MWTIGLRHRGDVARENRRVQGRSKVLRNFDQIFSSLHSSVDLIAESTGRPCHFLPLGIDALRFVPFPTTQSGR